MITQKSEVASDTMVTISDSIKQPPEQCDTVVSSMYPNKLLRSSMKHMLFISSYAFPIPTIIRPNNDTGIIGAAIASGSAEQHCD
jgi:hypothetical protein